MDALSLINVVETMVGRKFNVMEDELRATHIAPVHSSAKAEAL